MLWEGHISQEEADDNYAILAAGVQPGLKVSRGRAHGAQMHMPRDKTHHLAIEPGVLPTHGALRSASRLRGNRSCLGPCHMELQPSARCVRLWGGPPQLLSLSPVTFGDGKSRNVLFLFGNLGGREREGEREGYLKERRVESL